MAAQATADDYRTTCPYCRDTLEGCDILEGCCRDCRNEIRYKKIPVVTSERSGARRIRHKQFK